MYEIIRSGGLRRRKWPVLFAVVIGFALAFSVVACGSGGGGSGGGGGGSNNYNVSITATVPTSGVVKSMGTVNVTVTH